MLPLLLLAVLSAQAQNPYLPLWEHLPDGEPRVFEDPDQPGKFRAYIIGSHDTNYTAYCGSDIRMWSAPVEDLSQWRDEGPIFTHYVDGQWDTMFAPDLVEVKDKATGKKTYYLYPHSRGWQRVPMVCKGDRPNGPFTPINLTEDGRKCLPGSLIDFDPSSQLPTKRIRITLKASVPTYSMVSNIQPHVSWIRTPCTLCAQALSCTITLSPLRPVTVRFATQRARSIQPSIKDRILASLTSSRLRASVR